jgi:hypothetical protein
LNCFLCFTVKGTVLQKCILLQQDVAVRGPADRQRVLEIRETGFPSGAGGDLTGDFKILKTVGEPWF